MTPFQLTMMPAAKKAIRDITSSAKGGEHAAAIRQAFRTAPRQLKTDARNVGEPLYDLKHMRMRICRLIVAPLYVEFGVHFNLPSAFVRRVVLLR